MKQTSAPAQELLQRIAANIGQVIVGQDSEFYLIERRMALLGHAFIANT